MDDFEVFELEVSSLREATRRNGAPEEEGYDDPHADEVGVVPVASPAPRAGTRGTSYWRLIRAVVVGVSVLSMLALVLARSPGTPAIVESMFGIVTPTPTLPLTLGMDKFYPIYSVPWGSLRVDGRIQTFVVQQGQYLPVRIARGSHTLEYQAAPFPTLRCTISAPAAPTDTCPQVSTSSLLFDPVPQDVRGLAREIDLGATPDRLPADQRAALSTAVDVALHGDTTFHTYVAPGERYALANGGIAVAAQPLTATLRVTHTALVGVADGMGSPTIYGVPACADMCADVFSVDGNLSDWPLSVAAMLAWRYTLANGNMVAEAPVVPLAPGQVAGTSPTDYNAHVAVLWEHQQWTAHRIDQDLGNSLCNLGQFFVNSLYLDLNPTGAYNTFSMGVYMSPQPADGCYLTYQRGLTAAKQEPTSSYLFRLGVVLAVNAQAHRLFPKLPVADARDRDIVRQTGAPDQS